MSAPGHEPASIRDARSGERGVLEALQRRASLDNAGDREVLLAHPEAVELPQSQLDDGLVRVVEHDGRIVGFAALLGPTAGTCELDGLFVEPDAMGSGFGRLLVEDAARSARARGAIGIEVVANPHALAFYERVGFVVTGSVETRFGPALRMRRDVPGAR